ncbi:MAG: hypothetical protein ABW007_08650, partial [Chitinophagaceae bacterium]
WRAGSDSFFVPSLAFGAQTVPASHFLNAIFSKARLTERGRIVCDEDSFKFHIKRILELMTVFFTAISNRKDYSNRF